MNQSGVVKFFAKHFVAVGCFHESQTQSGNAPNPDSFLLSGFVVSVRGQWFWITAGHVLDEITKLLDQGRVINQCRFIDSWAGGAHKSTVPVDIEELRKSRIGGFEDVDIAAFFLSQQFRRLFTENGIEPLDEPYWKSPPQKFDDYFLLGAPTELIEKPTPYRCSADCTLHHVYSVELTIKDGFPRLTGHFSMTGPKNLLSIEGMSGGPLFGVRPTGSGSTAYWLVGVQSGWLKGSHTINAVPFQPFGTTLTTAVQELLAQREAALASAAS